MNKHINTVLIPIIILILGTILTIIFFELNNFHTLKNIGYSNYEELEAKLTVKEIEIVSTYEYNEQLPNIIFSLEYDSNKLEEYLLYSKKNPTLDGEIIVKLVNHNIDKLNIDYDPIMPDLVDQEYYLESNLERYLNYHKGKNINTNEIVANVNSNLDYEFYTNIKEANLSKGILILVNKYYQLPQNYQPNDLVALGLYGSWGKIKAEVYKAFIELNSDAASLGYKFYSVSPFRDYQLQETLFNRYITNYGLEYALESSAKPGHSEHQTGLALDLTNSKVSMYNFGSTIESEWLKENAHYYGFILRYPKGKEYITGYKYEPWHYRYVGKEVASYIYEHNLTFEEYYAYFIND